jgi:serine protease Do
MRSPRNLGIGIIAGCLAGIGLAWFGVIPAPAFVRSETGPTQVGSGSAPAASGVEPDVVGTNDGVHSRFAVLAREVEPGVVNVHTSKTVAQSFPDLGFPFGGFFGDLFGGRFGRQMEPQQEHPAPRHFTVPSLGTGFVISDDGLIVTNNHVVDGVDKIEVVFSDGTRSPAEIVGTDPKTDIALIRATAKRKYVPLSLGNSDSLLPGDWVIAVGNPFGLDHTVTAGIVSATGRDIGQGPYDDFIQTDAAINPGNSGGPLLNLAGQVVGINTAINPQANTIGFAVPINMAKEILPQLEKNGQVVRGWLGVAVQPVTPELADAMDLHTEEGALVSQVMDGSPAADAGLERGDVIVRFGSHEIHTMRELPRAVAETPVGTKVEVELVRGGDHKTKTVKIARLEEGVQHASATLEGGDRGSTAFGFDIADVPPQLQQRLGLNGSEGAVITNVYPGGSAESAGLRPGDVIVEVDRSAVSGGLDAEKKLVDAGEKTLLVVRRDDATFFSALARRDEEHNG